MSLDPRRHAFALAAAGWALLLAAVIAFRPLTPVDETRYATVAWEIWLSGDWVSLHLNGERYGHKPPLLFWLINLGWRVFGVSEWWPRLLTGLFALGALALVASLARRLAAGRDDVAAMTLWICGSSLYWMGFTGAVMFDLMLTFFVLLGVRAVAWAAAGGGLRAWLLAGVAMGLGVLTKGPVALLHVLPVALLAPWWRRGAAPSAAGGGPAAWYGGVGLSVGVAAAVALAWAVPSALAGGAAFGREIFVSQSVDRIVSTTHHLQPPWFYVAMLPVLLLPWLFFPAAWRGLVALARQPPAPGLRFALAWAVPVLLAFSAFRGKQAQYLLPAVPALAFVLASGLAALERIRRWESWLLAGVFVALAAVLLALTRHPRVMHLVQADEGSAVGVSVAALLLGALALAWVPWRDSLRTVAVVGGASVLMAIGLFAGFGRAAFDVYDLHPVGRHLAQVQQAGQPIAQAEKYHGQYQFIGRLQQPLEVVDGREALLAWAARQPEGRVVLYSERPLTHAGAARPEFVQKFKGRYVSVWRAADLPGVSEGWYRRRDDDGAG